MGETTYIVIDATEKRVYTGHNQDLDGIMTSLSRNPTTITEFDQYHEQVTGKRLYDKGNRPKVPDELSVDTIRTVLGMLGNTDAEVVDYWKRVSLHTPRNYQSFSPDERTEHDIPELTQEIIDEWKSEDPDAEEFPTANDYRRFLCNDGIVVADLRTKEVKYISHGAFDVPREQPTEKDKEHKAKFGHYLFKYEYSLPLEWRIVEE